MAVAYVSSVLYELYANNNDINYYYHLAMLCCVLYFVLLLNSQLCLVFRVFGEAKIS